MGGRGFADICGIKQNHDREKAGGGAEGRSGVGEEGEGQGGSRDRVGSLVWVHTP